MSGLRTQDQLDQAVESLQSMTAGSAQALTAIGWLTGHIDTLTGMVVDQQRTITELQAAMQDRNNLARETADARDALAVAERELGRYRPVCDRARDWVLSREDTEDTREGAAEDLAEAEKLLIAACEEWWATA